MLANNETERWQPSLRGSEIIHAAAACCTSMRSRRSENIFDIKKPWNADMVTRISVKRSGGPKGVRGGVGRRISGIEPCCAVAFKIGAPALTEKSPGIGGFGAAVRGGHVLWSAIRVWWKAAEPARERPAADPGAVIFSDGGESGLPNTTLFTVPSVRSRDPSGHWFDLRVWRLLVSACPRARCSHSHVSQPWDSALNGPGSEWRSVLAGHNPEAIDLLSLRLWRRSEYLT